MNTADKINELVQTLNRHRLAYYNLNAPEISDTEYDWLYEQLESLEEETGIIYSNSPTQTVGYPPVSELKKVPHPHPLLSLEKTKQVEDLCRFCGDHAALLMLKLDGLTVKLTYENGRLTEASTRGDGEIGEDITHNIPAFENVPISIAYKERLVVTGEAFICRKDFERLNLTIRDKNGKPYKNTRNLAAGSVRSLGPANCKGRGVTFLPFNVLEGLDEGENSNCREERLYQLSKLRFVPCPCCGTPTELLRKTAEKRRIIETVHCSNPSCESQQLKKFVHFVCRKAMNIEGLSEATLEKFLNLGYLQTFHDIYHLDQHREEIIRLEGFGEKSFDRLWNAIQASRNTTFVRYLISMDIPMVGRTKSRVLDTVFSGSLDDFRAAATDDYDFTQLEGFGTTLNRNIHDWFADEENLMLWDTLQKELTFEERKEETTMTKNNEFAGKIIVATGKLENFTRSEINDKILEIGVKPGSSLPFI